MTLGMTHNMYTEVKCRPVSCIYFFIVPHANAQTRARNETRTERERDAVVLHDI